MDGPVRHDVCVIFEQVTVFHRSVVREVGQEPQNHRS